MAATNDAPIQATVKVRESVWKLAKIEAIRRGCTLSALVESALEGALPAERQARTRPVPATDDDEPEGSGR